MGRVVLNPQPEAVTFRVLILGGGFEGTIPGDAIQTWVIDSRGGRGDSDTDRVRSEPGLLERLQQAWIVDQQLLAAMLRRLALGRDLPDRPV